MIRARMATTIKIPTPIPALNIPPTTSHPEKSSVNDTSNKNSDDFIIVKLKVI